MIIGFFGGEPCGREQSFDGALCMNRETDKGHMMKSDKGYWSKTI